MARILVIGEVLFDSYEGGKYLGGAPFNVAYHLASMGEKGAVLYTNDGLYSSD